MNHEKGFKVIDLFCGAGGMSTGFINTDFNVILGIDHNKNAIESFKYNHKKSKALCEDLKSVFAEDIKILTNDKAIDVIIGGPPCQGFSMAGRRIPNDPRNSLFLEYLRLVKDLKPKMFIMENVKGLLSMKNIHGEKVIDIILTEFKKAGYNTKCYKVNTADYGIPQKRHRIFIVGTQSEREFIFPEPTHSQSGISKSGLKIKKWVGLKKILEPKNKVDSKYYYSTKMINGFKRREKINKKKKVGYGWQFINVDKPSNTISARYYKDGAESLVKYSDKSIRMLTPKECAQIQSFPKSFIFKGNSIEVYRQIGNAVPPAMAKCLAKAVEAYLKGESNGE